MSQEIRRLKDGEILRYSSGLLGGKWKRSYAMLLSDSRFIWFERRGDQKAKGSVILRNVIPYICVGFVTDRMPVKRPNVPYGYSVQHLVGIGMNARADPVYWILFKSDADIESWFSEITKTFPKPTNPPPVSLSAPNGGYAPPAVYPTYPAPAQSYNAPRSFGPSNPPVIVQDRRSPGGFRNSGSSGLGGFGSPALGLGSGLLAGSLLGYGLGSVFGGHRGGFGGGPGWGGGGYYSDNDTNITNNYYNYGDGWQGQDGNGSNSQQPINDYGNANESSSWNQGQGNDYGDANLGDYGGGMDYGSAGLSDFGGDFGGGDFGGF